MTDELFPQHDDNPPPLTLEQASVQKPNKRAKLWEDPNRRPIRGLAWLAWIVVIGLTGFMMLTAVLVRGEQRQAETTKGELLAPILAGKIVVGLRELGIESKSQQIAEMPEQFLPQLNAGPIEQRLCFAILTSEIKSATDGLQALDDLKENTTKADFQYNEKQVRLESILRNVFQQNSEGQELDLPDNDQEFLTSEIPWFGSLALNPKQGGVGQRQQILDKTKWSMNFALFFFLGGGLCFLIGIGLFFMFLVKMFRGTLKHRMVDNSKYGPVYIETFAVWFLLFVGISFFVGSQIESKVGLSVITLMMGLPLLALAWPVIRGVSLPELLDDVGLKPCNPLKEMLAGIVAYLALLPLLSVGLILSVIVMAMLELFKSGGGVASEFAPRGVPHPIANEAFGGDLTSVFMLIFVMACVLAPLTEEIMFRGVLYRNLRDSSRHMYRVGSICFAALLSSVIFAAIHPQGIAGLPVLTALAFGFCLVRQWRGSLIAPITMHALHNGLASATLIPMLV